MELYLVQHGKALEKETNPERPLSEEGRAEVEKMAAMLSGTGVQKVIESGKARSTETAGILAAAIGAKAEKGEDLAPLDNPGLWAGRLNEATGNTMLVGHMPHLGKLASLLLAGAPEMGIVDFTPGSVLCLSRAEDKWTVRWMVRPDLLR